MGIQGLLPLLKDIQEPIHLRDFAGKSVGVDGYVWLHKGAYGCAFELCMNIPTKKYINYCMRKVKSLQEAGIWPIIVFDGDHLPIKSNTEQDRKSYYWINSKEQRSSFNSSQRISCQGRKVQGE